jgi:DNA-binding MarR family transcriptional regulator
MARTRTPSNASSAVSTQSWLSVVRAYNLCDAVMAHRLAAIGLRVGEHEVLLNLLRAPGITQQQLAQRCFVAKSGASMLVTRMEQSGWVLRQADAVDARVRRLFLTPDGAALAAQGQAIQSEVIATMVSSCSAAELKTITEVMQRASVALEALLDQGVA